MSADRKLSVRLRAEALREKVVRGVRVFAQHHRLDDIVVRQLGKHALRVYNDDGIGLGLQRRPGVLVHRRGLRAQAPGHHVLRGKHGLSDRHIVHLRSGLRLPLENGGVTERVVPHTVSAAGRIREFLFFSHPE